jgi:plastocyanin
MSPVRSTAAIRLHGSMFPFSLRLAAVGVWLAACSDPSAPAAGLKVTAVDPTNGQVGVVGAQLPLPLSVRIESDGEPRAGVTVEWAASAGSVLPAQSVSDGAGLASATWTLGTQVGAMSATSTVAGASGSPVFFSATGRAPLVRAAPLSPTDGQTGLVGTALRLPLRVLVTFEGQVKAGATVHWHPTAGSLSPETSTTDAHGIAVAGWTLGTVAGTGKVQVTVDDAPSPVTFFTAVALPGPAAGIAVVDGAAVTLPVNHASGHVLTARVEDQYGNPIRGEPVTWAVQQGPVGLLDHDSTTDADGLSTAEIDPTGEAGEAVVRAALTGAGQAAEFALTITAATIDVHLSANGAHSFVSAQNGSSPAVDTIPAGLGVTWILQFDYDQHAIVSVGVPSFVGDTFPYYVVPSLITVTFATPGTYHYTDPYLTGSAGTLVVQ